MNSLPINGAVLLVLALAVFGSLAASWFLQKMKISMILVYILAGICIGVNGFSLIGASDIRSLSLLNFFVLGIIGFIIGGELKLENLRNYAGNLPFMLLGEGLLTFFLTSLASALLIYYMSGNIGVSLVVGLFLGATASSTDSISTLDVIRDARAGGPVSSSIISLMTLDNALSILLFGLAAGITGILEHSFASTFAEIWRLGFGVAAAVFVGTCGAFILAGTAKYMHKPENILAVSLSIVLLVISAALRLGADIILASMALGFVFVNLSPRGSLEVFKFIKSFSMSIYILFFILAAARIDFKSFPLWTWALLIFYLLFRGIGKFIGAYAGASNDNSIAVKYLGLGLFPQGGLAVGLAIIAGDYLRELRLHDGVSIGELIIFVVTVSAFVTQLPGPFLVRLLLGLSGEKGRCLREEDILDGISIEEEMSRKFDIVRSNEPMENIIKSFVDNEHSCFVVLDDKGNLSGEIRSDDIRRLLGRQDSWKWLIAEDVMTRDIEKTLISSKFRDVYYEMFNSGIEQMFVFDTKQALRPVGVLDFRMMNRTVRESLMKNTNAAVAQIKKTIIEN